MIPDTLVRAARDHTLTPMQVRVYLLLHRYLDFVEFRPVKLGWLAHLTGLRDTGNTSRILGALVRRGYLARGPAVCEAPGRCYTSYRLTTVPPPLVTTATVPVL